MLAHVRSVFDPSPVFAALGALFVSPTFFSEEVVNSEKETGPCQRCDRNCIQEKYEVSNKIKMSTVARLVIATTVPFRGIRKQ